MWVSNVVIDLTHPARDCADHRYPAASRIPRLRSRTWSRCLEDDADHQNSRYAMEKVIDKLMGDTQGLASELPFGPRAPNTPVTQIEAPPELQRVRVNKCLISLIAKKLVSKTNEGVSCRHPFAIEAAGKKHLPLGRTMSRRPLLYYIQF